MNISRNRSLVNSIMKLVAGVLIVTTTTSCSDKSKPNVEVIQDMMESPAIKPQEFDASGIRSLRPYLNYLLENGAAEQVKVKWGKSERDVIMIDGKTYQYKGGHEINKNLGK